MSRPLGGSHIRPDARAKVAGLTRYSADMAMPGMLHAAMVLSKISSARVGAIDISPALAIDGVEAVLTAADIPGTNQVGVVFSDQPLLVTDRVYMVGDRLALVAARTPEAAHQAAKLVTAELEALPSVHCPVEAMKDGAARVRDEGNLFHTFKVIKGDLAAAEAEAEVIVEADYDVGGQEHAYLEPQGCLAIPEGRRRITIAASCQCPFYIQHAVSRALGIPLASVRVEQAPTGGAFGGKEDYPSEPAACAALLAFATGKPVRLIYEREDDLQITSKRHAVKVRHRWGADRDGKLKFCEVESHFDSGGYIGLSTVVAERGNVSAIGPYHVPAVRVATHVVYTNNLFGGAFRGFGAPQVTWAAEATMDRLAKALDMDPLEIRRINVLDGENDLTSTDQPLPAPILARECLDEAAEMLGWTTDVETLANGHKRGVGLSLVLYGCNLHHGGQYLDRSSAVLILQPDGSVIVRVGLTEMGQGNLVGVQAIAADALGIDPDMVEVWQPDTTTVADSGPTVASRGSHASGHATLDAVRRLRKRLDPVAAELLACPPEEIELGDGHAYIRRAPQRKVPMPLVAATMARRRIETIQTGWYRSPEREYDSATGLGAPYEFYAVACHAARVAVDPLLGTVKVEKIAAAHDVGRVLHRDALEGQIQGGVVQGMGWGVTEELRLDQGRLTNPNFTDYIIPCSSDAPEIEIAILDQSPGGGPYGAKGIGEPALIPTAAAVRNAVCHALGVEIDRLPVAPVTVVDAMGETHAWFELRGE